MKQVIVTEGIKVTQEAEYCLNIEKQKVTHCCGCFSCWLKTPGHCVFKELDPFYRAFVHADQVVFLAKVHQGFLSSQVKALFERMCPLYLPYISAKKEIMMHVPRYPHYPDILFYYQGDFSCKEEQEVFEKYIRRTFEQFYCKLLVLEQVEEGVC